MSTTNWETISARTWAAFSNTELAARYNCTPANVAHHRARLNAPASPEKPGGDRITPNGNGREITTAVINCTKAQKRRWLQARTKAGTKTWDQWAAAHLDAAAKTELED
jgi:hypothetical protein